MYRQARPEREKPHRIHGSVFHRLSANARLPKHQEKRRETVGGEGAEKAHGKTVGRLGGRK